MSTWTQSEIDRIAQYKDTMQVFERIETKIDDIRDRIHHLDVIANGTQIKQMAQQTEITALKQEVAALKSAYDRASGMWKLASVPGLVSFVYAVSQMIKQ